MLAQPVLHQWARELVLHRALAGWDTCGLQQGAGACPGSYHAGAAWPGEAVFILVNFYLPPPSLVSLWALPSLSAAMWPRCFGSSHPLVERVHSSGQRWVSAHSLPAKWHHMVRARLGRDSCFLGTYYSTRAGKTTAPQLILRSQFSTLCSVLWTSNREGSGGRCGDILLQESADLLVVVWGSESSRNSKTLYVLPGHRPKEAGGGGLGYIVAPFSWGGV